MADGGSNAVITAISLGQDHLMTERAVGLMLVGLTAAWVLVIIVFDSLVERRFVISVNLFRHAVDGLTFATGVTVAFVFIDPAVFALVASSYVYATVTAFSCIIGPLINMAERYNRVIDR